LYGVFGSLFGSNLGAVLYEKMLNPLVPNAEDLSSGVFLSSEVIGQLKFFWLIFAVLGVEDTPKTNHRAWKVMFGIYIVFTLAGVYFMISALFLAEQIQWKTFVQGLILFALGGGGIGISLRRRP